MILRTYWTILLIFVTVFMVYYNVTAPLVLNTEKLTIVQEYTAPVKKIVAFSLNKQIELEGEEYVCDRKLGNISLTNIKYTFGFWNKVDDTEVYITSVTFDKRLEPHYYLRIVGVIKGSWNETTYCQILTNDGSVRIIKSTVTPIWYEKWDMFDNNTYYNPILMSCRLPTFENYQFPMAVSFSPNPCVLPTTFHKIIIPEDTGKIDFTICVKPLNFKKEMSNHLVQWIELCKILGAQYIHIFVNNVTKTTRKVLKWYNTRFPDEIYIEDFSPVDTQCQNCNTSNFKKTWQRRRYEVAAYNKCFNRNINSKFIIPLDIDEVIVPKTVKYWTDLVGNLNNNYSSLIVQNVYFFRRNKTRYYNNRPFFLSENRRIKVPSKKGENGKSFISTKNALTVFNHYSLHLLRPGVIKEYFFPFRDVQLNHYKESCNHVIFPECRKYLSSPTVVDDVISRYEIDFNERYRNIIDRLKDDRIKLFKN